VETRFATYQSKVDIEDDEEHLGKATPKHHLHMEKAKAIHGVTRLGAWPSCGHPREGLQRGLEGSLHTSLYLGKNIKDVDGSLNLYRL
jgi:hypothetical protein